MFVLNADFSIDFKLEFYFPHQRNMSQNDFNGFQYLITESFLVKPAHKLHGSDVIAKK